MQVVGEGLEQVLGGLRAEPVDRQCPNPASRSPGGDIHIGADHDCVDLGLSLVSLLRPTKGNPSTFREARVAVPLYGDQPLSFNIGHQDVERIRRVVFLKDDLADLALIVLHEVS